MEGVLAASAALTMHYFTCPGNLVGGRSQFFKEWNANLNLHIFLMFYIEKALLHPPWESFSMLAIWKKIKNAVTKILHISTNLLGILWKVVCCKKCIILTPSAWSPFPSLIWSCFLFHFFFWFKNNEDSVTTNRHCVLKNEKWWQSMIESFATRPTY